MYYSDEDKFKGLLIGVCAFLFVCVVGAIYFRVSFKYPLSDAFTMVLAWVVIAIGTGYSMYRYSTKMWLGLILVALGGVWLSVWDLMDFMLNHHLVGADGDWRSGATLYESIFTSYWVEVPVLLVLLASGAFLINKNWEGF